jgi:predicted O-methyltransferase YrrM
MTDYQYTKDWFHWAPEVWTKLIPLLPEGGRSFLEIGSFEGRSTVWTIENMMNSGDWIDCVDTWEGGEEHSQENMSEVEGRFNHNVAVALDLRRIEERLPEMQLGHTSYYGINKNGSNIQLYKYKATSTQMLATKLAHWVDGKDLYDFIYIDGSHIAKDVLTDATMAWPLLKPKGMMVFDDYMWGNPRDILHRPKPAIDAFCNLFAEEAEIVHVGYQLVVRKKG